MEKQQDSKISRMFLRMVLKEQGQPIAEELQMNSWEMVDLIIKNIHLVDIEVRNLKSECKRMKKDQETRAQGVFDAISAFYCRTK